MDGRNPSISLRRSAADRHLVIEGHGSGEGRLHALWLRDACGCGSCRRASTNERLFDPTGLGRSLTLVSVDPLQPASAEEPVEISFSDGHSSRFPLTDLLAAADYSTNGSSVRPDPLTEARLSSSTTLFETKVEALEHTLAELLDAVWFDGLAMVRGVEPTEAGLLSVAEQIGPVMPTNYGITWSFEAEVPPAGGPISRVESRDALRMHADLPYRANPPGVQLNLGVSAASKGGASTFVDAYTMAERVRAVDPRAWELLTTVPFTYPYRRPGVDLSGGGPMVGLGPDGRYGIVRRAPDLVGSPQVSTEDATDLYRALALWQELVDNPANQLQVRLEEGDLVIFDNHRLLHGRTAFELQPGERRCLMGCYLDMDELRNRRAILAATPTTNAPPTNIPTVDVSTSEVHAVTETFWVYPEDV